MLFGRKQSNFLANSMGPSDPYFSSVELLLIGENGNNSTTFTDYSSKARVPTASFSIKNSTDRAKHGTGSLYLAGQTDYIRYASDAAWDFSVGSWTIEFWGLWPSGFNWSTNNPNITYQGNNAANVAVFQTSLNIYTGNGTYAGATSSIQTETWYHFAICKTTGVNKPRMFRDGVELTVTGTPSWRSGSSTFEIGRSNSGVATQNKYIDDIRITKGVARYTGNFTPPGALV